MTEKILLTAARSPVTLDLARQLHRSGHDVFVADTTSLNASRFSNSVKETFVIPSPRLNPAAFLDALKKIVEEQKITLLIPIYEEILFLTKEAAKFPSFCRIFGPSFETVRTLHNKWMFYSKLTELGIDSPKTVLIQSEEELKNHPFSGNFALKKCYSRASLSLKKVSVKDTLPKIEIEPKNPWIAQEWLDGERYCTYSVCQNGEIKAHSAYPVGFAIDGTSCLTFKATDHPKILEWIEFFVRSINFTGQIAFDFIEQKDKKIYAIECNPRATSGVHLFHENDRLDKAFLNKTASIITPQKGRTKQLSQGMMLYGWRKGAHPNNTWKNFLKAFFTIQDVTYCKKDRLPFFAAPLIFVGIFAKAREHKISIPAAFTFDFEWNGE